MQRENGREWHDAAVTLLCFGCEGTMEPVLEEGGGIVANERFSFDDAFAAAMRDLDRIERSLTRSVAKRRGWRDFLPTLSRKLAYTTSATVMGAYLTFANFYTTTYGTAHMSLSTLTRRSVELRKEALGRNEMTVPKSLEEHLRDVELKIGQHLVVIDPSPDAQLENIYRVTLEKVETYRISTGRNPGPKERRGDSKTPENRRGEAFYIQSIENTQDWIDGFDNVRGAFGPYGARFDTLDRRLAQYGNNRSPFLLHGTHEPHKIGTPASHGCVRHRNEDLLSIVERGIVAVGTPVIIKTGILNCAAYEPLTMDVTYVPSTIIENPSASESAVDRSGATIVHSSLYREVSEPRRQSTTEHPLSRLMVDP